MSPLLEVHGLVKRFWQLTAVNNFSTELDAGVVALIGPNNLENHNFQRSQASMSERKETSVLIRKISR